MSLSANTIWEVRTDGDDANGGGFVTGSGGTDYSQQATAVLSLSDGATSGVGVATLTSATGGFTPQMVGNILQVVSGTNAVANEPYQIVGFTDANTITLDRAPDDGVGGVSGAVVNVGGAMASLGGLGALIDGGVFNNKIVGGVYVRSGSYTVSSATPNTSNGPISVVNRKNFWIEGYNAAGGRGDWSDRPVLTVTTPLTNAVVLNRQDRYNEIKYTANLEVDADGLAPRCFQGNTTNSNFDPHFNCIGRNATGNNFLETTAVHCESYGSASEGYRLVNCLNCLSDGDATGGGVSIEGFAGFVVNCLVINGGGNGISVNRGGYAAFNTAYNNDVDGLVGTDGAVFVHNLSVGNGAYGFDWSIGKDRSLGNASYGNTSGDQDGSPLLSFGFVSLAADPFVNAAGGDFRLTSDAAALVGVQGVVGVVNTQFAGAFGPKGAAGGGSPGLIRTLQRISGANFNG